MTSVERFVEGLKLELGDQLQPLELTYTVHGDLKNPVIWICHALTANSDPTDWWPQMVGEGKILDTGKYAIVCCNMLGSCYGSTFAGSDELRGIQYGIDFPKLTNRDIAKAFDLLRRKLGIESILLATGASMGGQQLLEWAYMQPKLFQNLFLIGTNARHSPWGIAFNETQRMALMTDAFWKNPDDETVKAGLRSARAIAMLSYRSYAAYYRTQMNHIDDTDDYKASSYQQYQGLKLQRRFHPWAYYTLSKAMDSHNIGRNRGSIEQALLKINMNTLICGIKTDYLFPVSEQKYLARHMPNSMYIEIESDFGHDGFLVEAQLVSQMLADHILG